MTYEYLCTACGHEWEADQSISAKPLKKCPKCSKLRARRQVSGGTGFLLKGGGWYADGYGSTSGGKSAESSDGGAKEKKSDKADKKGPSEGKSGAKTSSTAKKAGVSAA